MMESGRAILDVSRATLPLSDWGRVADFTVLEGALSIFFEHLVDEMGFEPTTSSLRTGNH